MKINNNFLQKIKSNKDTYYLYVVNNNNNKAMIVSYANFFAIVEKLGIDIDNHPQYDDYEQIVFHFAEKIKLKGIVVNNFNIGVGYELVYSINEFLRKRSSEEKYQELLRWFQLHNKKYFVVDVNKSIGVISSLSFIELIARKLGIDTEIYYISDDDNVIIHEIGNELESIGIYIQNIYDINYDEIELVDTLHFLREIKNEKN